MIYFDISQIRCNNLSISIANLYWLTQFKLEKKVDTLDYLVQNSFITDGDFLALVTVLFVGGLLGSFTHCAGMCGPFIIAQKPASSKSDVSFSRATGWSLLPYHLGRMTTYTLMGGLAAYFSGHVMRGTVGEQSAAILLMAAGALFIITAWPTAKSQNSTSTVFTKKISGVIGRLSSPFISGRTSYHSYILGILLGFMPCGFLYAAILAVSASGSPGVAAIAMAAFTLGTMPSLILIGISRQLLFRHWPRTTQVIARTFMTLNGLSLVAMAGGILF